MSVILVRAEKTLLMNVIPAKMMETVLMVSMTTPATARMATLARIVR